MWCNACRTGLGIGRSTRDVTGWAAYVAPGGPRFYLALSPIDGFPNKGYLIVNVEEFAGVAALGARVRAFAADALPEARVAPEPMSLGPGTAGGVAYRVFGAGTGGLMGAAGGIQAAVRQSPGASDVKDDWENPSITIRVVIDQTAARRDGVTSADIANALNAQLNGIEVSSYRVGDLSIPLIARATGDARINLDRLRPVTVVRTGRRAGAVAAGGPVAARAAVCAHQAPRP